MKILVTGSSGFIGGELVKDLEGKHEIVLFDLLEDKDILNYEQLKDSMKGCEVVVHLAALRKPYEDKTFEDYFRVNCIGTFNVCKAAKECGVKKLVYSSSTSYYGIEKGMPEPSQINEKTPVLSQRLNVSDLNCRDCDVAYSTSKVISEQILANYGLTKKMNIVILRFGPTRKRGEYRPFGNLKLHLKIENALQALNLAIGLKKEIWYEAFTITDEIKDVDLAKAKEILGYNPQ